MTLVNLFFIINIILFILFLNIGKRYAFLSPLNIFGVSYFIHLIFGQLVWILKEIFLINNEGSPVELSIYFLFISSIFVFLSIRKTYVFKDKGGELERIKLHFNYPALTRIVPSLIFAYIGVYLFTSGFTNIPILSSNIDEARIGLMQEKGNRGIGSILLLTAIHSIFRIRVSRAFIGLKILLYLLFFIPFVLYGGRLLMILPIIIVLLPFIYKIRFSFSNFLSGIIVILFFLTCVNYFGTLRKYGNVEVQNFMLYSWADSFNEFSHASHAIVYGERNFGNDFIPTFIASFFPSMIFDALGLNKDDYYHPIGLIVNQNTIYESSPDIGIRLSLFGELYMCSGIATLAFVIAIFIMVHKCDSVFTRIKEWTLARYMSMLTGIFLAISIPYGLSFITVLIQFIIFTFILFNLKFRKLKSLHTSGV